MTTTHTPGQWQIKEVNYIFSHNTGLPPFIILNESGTEIASTNDGFLKNTGVEDHYQQAEANARLIASAPELLQALTALLNADRINAVELFKIERQAEAAINKAING